jgi:hypothetical protein
MLIPFLKRAQIGYTFVFGLKKQAFQFTNIVKALSTHLAFKASLNYNSKSQLLKQEYLPLCSTIITVRKSFFTISLILFNPLLLNPLITIKWQQYCS